MAYPIDKDDLEIYMMVIRGFDAATKISQCFFVQQGLRLTPFEIIFLKKRQSLEE